MPFGEDVMTIIMGIDPSEPGMHGPCDVPCPTDDAVGLVTKIRDMCDKWLRSAGKGEEESEPKPTDQPTEVGDTDTEE
jgi:hypothetical protein